MPLRPAHGDPERQRQIRALFDAYIEMYASRDDRLTARFGDNFSGYTGSGDFLVRDRAEWVRITRQDFAQVSGRIHIEMLDLVTQDLSDDVVVATALFRIHLPSGGELLAKEAVRLVLIFRLEGDDWKIVHSGISVAYRQVQEGEVYPLKSLQQRNSELEALVDERTQALHASEALYRMLTEDTQDVIWKADAGLRITYISPADERLRGFRADEVVGSHVFEMFTPEGVATIKKMVEQRAAQDRAGVDCGFQTVELQHRCKDGRLLWGELMSKPDRNTRGEIVGYHGITREITQRKLLEERVRELAFHDTLTRLYNRRHAEDRLALALSASRRSGRHGALLFIDLDNFKPLNDLHGHAAGDLLLIEVARRLQACVREIDTVARFGGDEFLVLLGELSTDRDEAEAQAGGVAEKIRAGLAAPYVLEAAAAEPGATVAVVHHSTASIGVALFRGDGRRVGELIDRADSAMYLAKDGGPNRVCFAPPGAG